MPKYDELPFYRHIITDAWHIAKEHKHLWIFGFFATFIGYGGVADLLFKMYDRQADIIPALLQSGASPFDVMPGVVTVRTVINYSSNPVIATVAFLALMAAIFAVLAWMVTVSLGALVGSVKKIVRGGEPTFADGLKLGAAKFWPLLAINAGARALTIAAFAANGLILFYLLRDKTAVNALLYVASSLALTAAAIMVSLAAVYASSYAVLKDEPADRAVAKGWNLLLKHWLVSAEMVLVIFVVNLVVAIAAVLGVTVLSVPIVFLFLVAVAAKSQALILVLTGLGGFLVMLTAMTIGSFLTTLQVSAWTLLWEELVEGKPVSKIHRIVHWLKSKR